MPQASGSPILHSPTTTLLFLSLTSFHESIKLTYTHQALHNQGGTFASNYCHLARLIVLGRRGNENELTADEQNQFAIAHEVKQL